METPEGMHATTPQEAEIATQICMLMQQAPGSVGTAIRAAIAALVSFIRIQVDDPEMRTTLADYAARVIMLNIDNINKNENAKSNH